MYNLSKEFLLVKLVPTYWYLLTQMHIIFQLLLHVTTQQTPTVDHAKETCESESTPDGVWEGESHLRSTIGFSGDYAMVTTANIVERGAGSREEKQLINGKMKRRALVFVAKLLLLKGLTVARRKAVTVTNTICRVGSKRQEHNNGPGDHLPVTILILVSQDYCGRSNTATVWQMCTTRTLASRGW